MRSIKIYLDTCCYNRPYDDLDQDIVRDEAIAVKFIQYLVRYNLVELVHSYILQYEINKNPFHIVKDEIFGFLEFASEFVSGEFEDHIIEISLQIRKTGVKPTDALHVAAALYSHCDYFITTDRRILKYKNNDLIITDPITFCKIWRDNHGT
jgi:predicted nucleic acid-binding protein